MSRAGRETTPQTEQAQKVRYLNAVEKVGTTTAGCKAARVSPHTVYAWREHDTEFVIAEHDARERCADSIEASVIRRARGRSDILAMFMLKAMRPAKYRERIGVEHSGSITTVDSELDARITHQLAKMVAGSQSPPALAAPGETRTTHSTG